jgi:hypothetical protein
VLVSVFCVPADDATLEGSRTEHKNIFHVSQTPRLIRCRSITTPLIHIAATTTPQIIPARICTSGQTMWNIQPQSYEVGLGGGRD